MNIGDMTEPGLLALMALMFIGGSAGSTAGGIKVQTFSLLFFAIVSAVRGLPEVVAFRRQVPTAEVLRAVAVVLIGASLIVAFAFFTNVFEPFSFVRVLFEVTSAFGTVGLSTGITPDTGPVARGLLIIMMFAGRVGPLTLVFAVASREHRSRFHWPEEMVRIG
jgi:trk system potassium uptake protein